MATSSGTSSAIQDSASVVAGDDVDGRPGDTVSVAASARTRAWRGPRTRRPPGPGSGSAGRGRTAGPGGPPGGRLAGTTTPGRRASRCNEVHPSRRSARKASCFEGRSVELIRARERRMRLESYLEAPVATLTVSSIGCSLPQRPSSSTGATSSPDRWCGNLREKIRSRRVRGLVFAIPFREMNRLTPAPPPGAPPRFPSGWRARLGRDPGADPASRGEPRAGRARAPRPDRRRRGARGEESRSPTPR